MKVTIEHKNSEDEVFKAGNFVTIRGNLVLVINPEGYSEECFTGLIMKSTCGSDGVTSDAIHKNGYKPFKGKITIEI